MSCLQTSQVQSETLFQYLQSEISKCSCSGTCDYATSSLFVRGQLNFSYNFLFCFSRFSVLKEASWWVRIVLFGNGSLKRNGKKICIPIKSSTNPITVSEFWTSWSLSRTNRWSLYVIPIYSSRANWRLLMSYPKLHPIQILYHSSVIASIMELQG